MTGLVNEAVGILMANDRLAPAEATAALHREGHRSWYRQAAEDVINEHRRP